MEKSTPLKTKKKQKGKGRKEEKSTPPKIKKKQKRKGKNEKAMG
jgi:hypothetical protein